MSGVFGCCKACDKAEGSSSLFLPKKHPYHSYCVCKRCGVYKKFLKVKFVFTFRIPFFVGHLSYLICKKLRSISWLYWLYHQLSWWYYFLPYIWGKKDTDCHRHIDCYFCIVSFPFVDKKGEYVGITLGGYRKWAKAISLWKVTRRENELGKKRKT